MRIGHIVTLLSKDGAFGGPVSVAWQQAMSLSERQHEVFLLAGWDGQADVLHSKDVHVRLFKARRVAWRTGASGLYTPDLYRYLVRNGKMFDIIHIHLARDLVTLGAVQIVSMLKVPFVVQPHGMIVPDQRVAVTAIDLLATRRALRKARRVFSLTDEEDTALGCVVDHDLSVERLRNGIAANANVVTTEPALPGQDVLFCARLHPRKRVMVFAEMVNELIRRGVGARFSVVGPDGGDLDVLLAHMRDNPELGERLTYEGPLPPEAVNDRLRKASVFVLPSVNEPFPMTVLEAMGVGTPVVLTNTCHIADELGERGAALVTDGTPGRMADAVQTLLYDQQKMSQIRLSAFEALADLYSIESVTSQLERAYLNAAAI